MGVTLLFSVRVGLQYLLGFLVHDATQRGGGNHKNPCHYLPRHGFTHFKSMHVAWGHGIQFSAHGNASHERSSLLPPDQWLAWVQKQLMA